MLGGSESVYKRKGTSPPLTRKRSSNKGIEWQFYSPIFQGQVIEKYTSNFMAQLLERFSKNGKKIRENVKNNLFVVFDK